MSDALQNILILVGLVLIAFVGWYMYNENQRTALNAGEGTDLQADIQSFLQLQTTLRSISIDTSLLDDPRFQSLDSVTGPVPALDSGRDNPFVPAN